LSKRRSIIAKLRKGLEHGEILCIFTSSPIVIVETKTNPNPEKAIKSETMKKQKNNPVRKVKMKAEKQRRRK
jgi:hypothetical protein